MKAVTEAIAARSDEFVDALVEVLRVESVNPCYAGGTGEAAAQAVLGEALGAWSIGSTTWEPTAADLAPFQAAIAAKVPLIMSSNAVYPRLDSRRIAAQSPAILKTLLRDQLHFGGVVITDSIEAAAVRATGSTEQIAVRSIRAGNDIVLTTGQGSWIHSYRALLAEARASRRKRLRAGEVAAKVEDMTLMATIRCSFSSNALSTVPKAPLPRISRTS